MIAFLSLVGSSLLVAGMFVWLTAWLLDGGRP